jgi:formate-dependent nitrite reductase membrane component NrfD
MNDKEREMYFVLHESDEALYRSIARGELVFEPKGFGPDSGPAGPIGSIMFGVLMLGVAGLVDTIFGYRSIVHPILFVISALAIGSGAIYLIVLIVRNRKRGKEIATGRAKFESMLPIVKAQLCDEWGACEKVRKYEDPTQLAMVMGDVLASTITGVPVATVSALVVKMGIKRLCACP